MRKSALFVICSALFVAGCNNNQPDSHPGYTGFIPKDTANKMIQSYLNSIDSNDRGEQLYSLIVNADELRAYLADTSVKSVKVMFAHTLDYINSGNANKTAGLKSGALTIVFAGFDKAGNYVFAPGMSVPDSAEPCPPECPTQGTAADNLLR